jgi:methionine biosynthesis protein MetW
MSRVRYDLQIIRDWIKPNSRVLDLGCGNGELLQQLAKHNGVTGYGVELADLHVTDCIRAGINVIQGDLDLGLSEFDDDSFDYVILSMTLQASRYPDQLIREMLRVGNQGIVTFPNFGHYTTRLQLALRGRMPVTRTLPLEWYNTTNIHLCTFTDFESLCAKFGIEIIERRALTHTNKTSLGLRLLPNLLGEIALYRFRRKQI